MFWQPSSTTGFQDSTVDLSSHIGDENYKFASLGIIYSGVTTISIDLAWTPFYMKNIAGESYTLDTSVKCDYTLGLDLKGTNSDLYSWNTAEITNEDSFTNGFHVKYKRKKLIESMTASQVGIETNEPSKNIIADMYISELDTSKVSSGQFLSFLICYITSD